MSDDAAPDFPQRSRPADWLSRLVVAAGITAALAIATAQSQRVDGQAERIAALEAQVSQFDELRDKLSAIDAKLDRLIERNLKK